MSSGHLGKRVWFNLVLFGLMGQIAWNVENMYFNTFLCNYIYGQASAGAVGGSMSIVDAVAWMVGLSAFAAVTTTFLIGNLSDRIHNRKIFISVGYILWGIVTGCFGFISLKNVEKIGHFSSAAGVLTTTVWIVVAMDCLMTFMGSASNDSAFNAWVTDVTNTENRTKVETLLMAMPLVAMGIVLAVGGAFVTKYGYPVFFFALGAFVSLCGIVGLFTLKDSVQINGSRSESYWKDLFYGFKPSVIREHPRLYLTLATMCIYNTAFQVFFPYLIVYLQHSELDFLNHLPTLLSGRNLIILSLAVLSTVLILILFIVKVSVIGKGKCLLLCSCLFVGGLFSVYRAHTTLTFVLGCCPFLVGYAVLGIIIGAVIRDFTPEDKTGLFQGVRMIFMVLIPMIAGPRLAAIATRNSAITYINDVGAVNILPSSTMFLVGGIVGLFMFFTIIPLLKKGIEK